MIKFRPIIFILILGFLLSVFRLCFPERGFDTLGFRAWTDAIFSVVLWILIWVIAVGVGRLIFRNTPIDSYFSGIERFVFNSGLGLGIVGIGMTILGLAGLLKYPFIPVWLLLCASSWSLVEVQMDWPRISKELVIRAVLVLAGAILCLTILQALAPPWDYDGLMYHLEGPRRFLDVGRIYFIPEIWQANGPFLTEMIFSIGLAFGSDTFPKFIHLTFAILVFLATYTFAYRYLGRAHAWTSVAILLGIAILPIWASWAYTDFGWAFFDFLALYFVIIWMSSSKNPNLLIFSGFFSGFAMGTKYLAIAGAFLLTLGIIWDSRNLRLKHITMNVVYYLIPATSIAAIWWIKNLILIGNPIFPFIFPSNNWDSQRINLLMMYLRSFGTNSTIWDFLLLPIKIYLDYAKFGTFSQETPSLLFPIAIIYAVQRKSRALNIIGIYAIGEYIIWALGSMQVRFLLTTFPSLAIITSYVILSIPIPVIKRIALISFVGGLILSTIAYQGLYLAKENPIPVILGLETKNEFLRRTVYTYSAYKFIEDALPSDIKVLTLWNGQSYYCRKCLPDADQNAWNYIADEFSSISSITNYLKINGVSYILFSGGDFVWFQKYHNPNGVMDKALASFFEYIKSCGSELYNDGASIIYAITCQ